MAIGNRSRLRLTYAVYLWPIGINCRQNLYNPFCCSSIPYFNGSSLFCFSVKNIVRFHDYLFRVIPYKDICSVCKGDGPLSRIPKCYARDVEYSCFLLYAAGIGKNHFCMCLGSCVDELQLIMDGIFSLFKIDFPASSCYHYGNKVHI